MQVVFRSAANILAEPMRTDWIVRPFLAPGSSMMLYGRQGVGKSSLALQLAAALTQQTPWLGIPTSCQGATAFLELDMPHAELRLLLQRAEKQLFVNGTRHAIHFPSFWDGDIEMYDFDVLRDDDCKGLMEAILEVNPVLLVVDTINEAFHRRDKRTGGEEIRQAIRRLRKAVEATKGATVYLQHKRKRQSNTPANDPDAFLGAVELEAVATASCELQRTTAEDIEPQRFAFVVHKSRLEKERFSRMELGRDEHGFFYPIWGATTALACWPYCLPPEQRIETSDRATILQTIEDVLRLDREALNKAAQRAVALPWDKN